MSKSTHTSGNWQVQEKMTGSTTIVSKAANGVTRAVICGIYPTGNYNVISYAEKIANAKMIAAAPDLLAACQAALKELEDKRTFLKSELEKQEVFKPEFLIDIDLIDDLRLAIKKATA